MAQLTNMCFGIIYKNVIVHFVIFVIISYAVLGNKTLSANNGHSTTPLTTSIDCFDAPSLKCNDLKTGQFFCDDPKIDEDTQEPIGCSNSLRKVKVDCYPVANICCDGVRHTGSSIGFSVEVQCRWTNGKKFSTAMLLSVFLGWLGIDRFYLGYPALGLLKMSTFGFMFIWALADIILIAIQVVKPADGSEYVIDYYGPRLNQLGLNNETFFSKN